MVDIKFEDKGKIPIPDKGDINQEKMISQVEKKIEREQIEQGVRKDTGTEPEKKGSLTYDVPQMAFRVIAGVIDCKRFELSDEEARIMATHINILLPLEGKIISIFVILMIVLNKTYACMDAIKRLQTRGSVEAPPVKQADLPEPLK